MGVQLEIKGPVVRFELFDGDYSTYAEIPLNVFSPEDTETSHRVLLGNWFEQKHPGMYGMFLEDQASNMLGELSNQDFLQKYSPFEEDLSQLGLSLGEKIGS